MWLSCPRRSAPRSRRPRLFRPSDSARPAQSLFAPETGLVIMRKIIDLDDRHNEYAIEPQSRRSADSSGREILSVRLQPDSVQVDVAGDPTRVALIPMVTDPQR